MFTRFLSMVLALSLFSVAAHAASRDGLKSAFDELNYALTVEWDQQNQAFLKAQTDKFHAEISALEAQGLTQGEMLDFVKSEVADGNLSKELESVLDAVSFGKMSTEEARQHMVKFMNNSYDQGASWTARGGLTPLGLILLIYIIIVFTQDCEGDLQGSEC